MSANRRLNRSTRSTVSKFKLNQYHFMVHYIFLEYYCCWCLQQSAYTSFLGTNPENSDVETSENISAFGPNFKYTTMGQYEKSESFPKQDQNSSDSNDDIQSDANMNIETIINEPTTYPIQPKHIRFPDVPYSSEMVNELIIFAYTLIATAMQFLHLYRTVWWLPESNTNQAMVKFSGSTFYYLLLLLLATIWIPNLLSL